VSDTTHCVLAHGAGAGSSHRMRHVASAFEAVGRVVTFDFPYIAEGRKLPDKGPVSRRRSPGSGWKWRPPPHCSRAENPWAGESRLRSRPEPDSPRPYGPGVLRLPVTPRQAGHDAIATCPIITVVLFIHGTRDVRHPRNGN
jgi:hypothetical protein